MGTNTFVTQVNGTPITADTAINQIKAAIINNIAPRNSSGIPEDYSGELGTSTHSWLEAFIASGYWNAGDIKPHHSYDGLVSVGQGWYPCDGTIINEANYNSIHGVGSWAAYIGTSSLDGKYSPDIDNRLLVGAAATSESGSTPIATTGNTSHQIDISHLHLSVEHNHHWHQPVGSSATVGIQLDTVGNVGSSYDIDGNTLTPLSSTTYIDKLLYDSNEQQLFLSGLSSTQSIRPESIELIYYIRII